MNTVVSSSCIYVHPRELEWNSPVADSDQINIVYMNRKGSFNLSRMKGYLFDTRQPIRLHSHYTSEHLSKHIRLRKITESLSNDQKIKTMIEILQGLIAMLKS